MVHRIGVFGRMAMVAAVAILMSACQYWPQFMGGPGLTGDASSGSQLTTSNVGGLTEQFRVPFGGSGSIVQEPVATGNTLYATASSSTGLEGGATETLAAADLGGTTGCSGVPKVCTPLWTADIPALGQAQVPNVSMPVLAGRTVFVLTYDALDSTGGELLAFDASGTTNCSGTPKVCRPLWSVETGVAATMSYADGILYVIDEGTQPDFADRGLEAFDANGPNCSGTPVVCGALWTAPGDLYGTPAVADGKVYVASSTGPSVQVFDAAGTTRCSGTPKVCAPLWSVTGVRGPVSISNGVGYGLASSGQTDSLAAFDATICTSASGTCRSRWTAPLAGQADGIPAVSGGHVFVVSTTSTNIGVVDEFTAGSSPACGGAPPVCAATRTATDSSESYGGLSPTATSSLVFVGRQAYDASGTAGCVTPTGGTLTCGPLWTASAGRGTANSVLQSQVLTGGGDGDAHIFGLP